MARREVIVCDVCKKPTERVVFKLFLSDVKRVAPHRSPHSDYTHHCDVGECCADKLKAGFSWHKRMTAQQYREQRKLAKNGRN